MIGEILITSAVIVEEQTREYSSGLGVVHETMPIQEQTFPRKQVTRESRLGYMLEIKLYFYTSISQRQEFKNNKS